MDVIFTCNFTNDEFEYASYDIDIALADVINSKSWQGYRLHLFAVPYATCDVSFHNCDFATKEMWRSKYEMRFYGNSKMRYRRTTNIIYVMEELDSQQYEYWDKLQIEGLCLNGMFCTKFMHSFTVESKKFISKSKFKECWFRRNMMTFIS